jgi:hypothetical protein
MNPSTEKKSNNLPLNLFYPYNIVILLTFYSPLIVSIMILSMTFTSQNWKGIICLAFIIGSVLIRDFTMWITGLGKKTNVNENRTQICDVTRFSIYGPNGVSVFVLSFVLAYIAFPMFYNKDFNYLILGMLLVYLMMDIFVRYMQHCFDSPMTDILINALSGITLGIVWPSLLYMGGSSKYLFFNEISSSKEVCSMPKKQQFKCSVYKNGELVAST